MMAKTFCCSTISRQTCTALVGLYWSSRKTTSTLRPWTPPFSARCFQYRSALCSKALWGKGAAPVTGAWIPIRMVVSVTPVRSGSPSKASRGGAGAGAGPLAPGERGGDGDGPRAGDPAGPAPVSDRAASPGDGLRGGRARPVADLGDAAADPAAGAGMGVMAGAGGPNSGACPSPVGNAAGGAAGWPGAGDSAAGPASGPVVATLPSPASREEVVAISGRDSAARAAAPSRMALGF